MVNLIIPDKWQQDAVNLLREGKDVVVHAPTGAGKTYIFELLYGSLKGQAVYTVPTRALANDKLAEWRARGWEVGISTGDVAENLGARVVVATLETQKARILRGEGPKLLVVDEYQLLGDPTRGMNYELILALAPKGTQLLLLSGSVGNPEDIVAWLRRIGREVELIKHLERPVRLDEVLLNDLPVNFPGSIRGYWPKLVARALASDLGPILIFAPRRNAAEELAQELAFGLPAVEPLVLSQEQSMIAGESFAKLLRRRIAFHHSGLSYAVRAGILEPLAKRGQLKVVVATMGLAAGINFSMRSVLVTGTHYYAGNFQRNVRPDELLQMFGRAGRRGLDEVGYVLFTPDLPRLHEAYPKRLRRAEPVDWPSMMAVMQQAKMRGEDPFRIAVELSDRLFSSRKLPLGVEVWYGAKGTPEGMPFQRPCGIKVDAERGRFVRRHQLEMKDSRGAWERQPDPEETTLRNLWVRAADSRWKPALRVAETLKGIGIGSLCKLRSRTNAGESSFERGFEYGREVPVAIPKGGKWSPVKWLRKALQEQSPILAARKIYLEQEFLDQIIPVVALRVLGKFVEMIDRQGVYFARFEYGERTGLGFRDRFGHWLSNPETRRNYPEPCQPCRFRAECESLDLTVAPTLAWRELGLIELDGAPTRRGVLFSFFNQGEGLAIAAALEQEDYRIEDLIFDLGNLRAGYRFAMDDSRASGRLGFICQQTYQRLDFPGYLEVGVPPGYGAGAAEVIRDLVEHQVSRHKLVTTSVRHGDIERALTEWRSLLRQIVQAPGYNWERWGALKEMAKKYIGSTESPAHQPLPALLPSQLKGTWR